jgi:hypothetical protein
MLRPETLERAERGKGLSIQETHELAYEIVRLRGIEEQFDAAVAALEHIGNPNYSARPTGRDALDMSEFARAELRRMALSALARSPSTSS